VTALKAVGVVLMAAAAGCASPATTPATGPTIVPPGCEPAATNLRWEKPAEQPRLTRVTLYRAISEKATPGAGQDLLNEPFTTAVTQVTAPASWIDRLAESLRAETGGDIHTGTAKLKDGGYSYTTGGLDDLSIPETLTYEGVQAVSVRFTVDCTIPVSGTFSAWTSMSLGGVTCGSALEPEEALGRLARRYCPRIPSPPPSLGAVTIN
jgi:hypothetical protein